MGFTHKMMANPVAKSYSLPPEDLTFLSTKKETFRYRDLFRFADKMNHSLQPYELSESKPLLIFTENKPETVLVIASCFLMGIPVVPVSSEIEPNHLERLCSQLNPGAWFSNTRRSDHCLMDTPEFTPCGDLSEESTLHKTHGQYSNPQKIAGYFQTSGSTAEPKIVPIKRRQIFSAAHASEKNFKPAQNRYWLLCLPMNHVGGISVIYRSLLYHSAVYLVPEFDEQNIRSLLNNNKQFEAASMVPTMLERLLEDSFFRVQFNFKALLLGGGPISPELVNHSLTRGVPIVTSYGMTETFAQIAANPMLRSGGMYIPRKSVGKVFEPNEIEIRDDKGNPLPWLESGQIWLRGPQIFDGYLQEELNFDTFDQDGWFNTGDYGHLNRKKLLFIESRRTDLILSGGENINPIEVEEALVAYTDVSDAAVVGVPDREWGQKAVAFILPKNQTPVDPESLPTKLKSVLQAYKIPREFLLVDEIPRTATGKVRRSDLRDKYLKETGQK